MSDFIESSYFDKYGNKKQKYLNTEQVIFVFPNENPEWTEVIVTSGQMYFLQEPINSVMEKINQKNERKIVNEIRASKGNFNNAYDCIY